MINLDSDIMYLTGVGPSRGKLLKDEMGISKVADLLSYYPTRHVDRSRLYYIHELTTEMPYVQLRGRILSFEEVGEGRAHRLVAHFTDGLGVVDLVWFNGIKYIRKCYNTSTEYVVFGKPQLFKDRYSLTHPDVDAADRMTLSSMGMQPYYSVPEKLKKRGINSRLIETLTSNLFSQMTTPMQETLTSDIVVRLQLMSRDEAVRAMHYPRSAEQLTQATFRLKFEELFFVQLNILKYTRERQQHFSGHVFSVVGQMFNHFYSHQLPFQLTEAQKRVVREIHSDMRSGKQMNRLLQGDVGSGKTLVALLSMLIALDNGFQAVIMAPTEILAEQHLETFKHFLGDMPVRVELLTGLIKGKRRRETLEGLKDGAVNILVGTHAIIEDGVDFHNLGLAVIDEQHRFGVAQRARLWGKNHIPPHILVMTATPIPRTLAMTVYGDLDVSVIDELPPGRKPIQTVHHYEDRREDLYRGIRQQVSLGRQVYVVYPLVKESEKLDLKNVQDGYEHLSKVFPDYRISMVHGQMKPADKETEMQKFISGETQMLVATTVIEVGVNVPNASVMVIENAERFGLAQLHQLRGRVGRGAEQSYCILVTKHDLAQETRKRIQIMTQTNDGFEIAEADLKFRGPGDLEGTQQSGMAFDLKLANLGKDGQVVQLARDEARILLDSDPACNLPTNAMVWARLHQLVRHDIDWSSIS